MKYLFFSSDNNSGSGAFRALVRLVKDIKSFDNNEVFVVLPYGGSGRKMLKEAKIEHKIYFTFSWIKHDYFNPIDYLLYPFNKLNNFFKEKEITKFVKEYNPDLIIINTSYHYLGAKIAKKLNIPYVWHIREFLNEDQKKTYYNFNYALSLYNSAKKVICVSHGLYLKYAQKINKNILTYVYDGVNTKKFYNPNKEIFASSTIHFLNVGRIKHEKGQFLMIKALNELKDRFNFDITFVGYIHKFYKRKLLKLGKNIKERITFVGQVNDVNKYYEKSDVFIMPSLSEAFGLVTVEAMLNGLVVIASNSLGSKEIVENENNGYLFKANDYISLKNKIIELINNEDIAKRKALNGQLRALNNFNVLLNSENIYKIYKECLKNKSPLH